MYKNAYRHLFNLIVPPETQRLSILIYHRVLNAPDMMRPNEYTGREFSEQMHWLSEYFTPLTLSSALERLEMGTLPERAVVVTFDDGYADNLTVAYPLMQRHGVPLTVFVATDFINSGRMWNDTVIEFFRVYSKNHIDFGNYGLGDYYFDDIPSRRRAAYSLIAAIKYCPGEKRQEIIDFLIHLCPNLPDDMMLTPDQIRVLRDAGVEIGAHTCSHPILSEISQEQAMHEIKESKSILENKLSKPVKYFAYPNGKPGKDYCVQHRELVKQAGFQCALSTQWGVTDSSSDLLQLPRFTPWNRSRHKFLIKMLQNARKPF